MIKRLVLMALFYGIAVGFAQEPITPGGTPDLPLQPSPAPLPAPGLPFNATGWLDLLFKALPMLAQIFVVPLALQLINEHLPSLLMKVPKLLLPVIGSMIGAISGTITGVIDGLVLPEGGGVSTPVAGLEGGGAGAAVTYAMQKKPIPTADEKTKKAA